MTTANDSDALAQGGHPAHADARRRRRGRPLSRGRSTSTRSPASAPRPTTTPLRGSDVSRGVAAGPLRTWRAPRAPRRHSAVRHRPSSSGARGRWATVPARAHARTASSLSCILRQCPHLIAITHPTGHNFASALQNSCSPRRACVLAANTHAHVHCELRAQTGTHQAHTWAQHRSPATGRKGAK